MSSVSELGWEDRAAIRDVLMLYCVASDRRRFDDFAKVFAADVAWDFGDFGSGVGLAEMLVEHEPLLMAAGVTQHFLGESLVEATAGGADVITYAQFYLNDAASGKLLVSEGVVYHDEFARTSEGWRITKRRYEPRWHVDHPQAR